MEKAIIDSKEMQKLRRIKQLGNAHLIYPTAIHTRFDHSLGVNFVFKRIIFELKHKPEAEKIIRSSEILPIKIAALLHDVTHLPYSHTFEDNMEFWERHDEKRRYIELFNSSGSEIGNILKQKKIYDEVLELLTSKNPEKELDEPWKAQILTAPICADLLDYLRRDAYFCGLKRNYDDRIFKYFDLQNRDQKTILAINLTKNNNLRIDALSETLNILRLRCFLTQAVYYHHTKLCADAIISKALNIAFENQLISKETLKFNVSGYENDTLYQIGDEKFLDILLKMKNDKISKLISRIKERKLLKRAFSVTANTVSGTKKEKIHIKNKYVTNYRNNIHEKSLMENQIAEALDLPEEDIIIHCVGDESLKECGVCVRLHSSREIIELNKSTQTIEEVNRIEQEYLDLWKIIVFAPKENISQVNEYCKNEFHFEGEASIKHSVPISQMDLNQWQ
nr:HD domain-containing protein [uncultured Methanoregula sp.]